MPKSKSKSKKSKKAKTKKLAKTPTRVYVGYLVWFKVDLWKKTGKKASEAVSKVRDQLLELLKPELDAKTIVLRKEQPKDTVPYVLMDLDEKALEDATICGDNLMSKLRGSELVEWIEVEHYAGVKYEEKQ